MSKRIGSALVITLLFLTLISILVLGFMASMKIEVASANSHLQGTRAEYFAQAGIDIAEARIRTATAVAGTNDFWISQPGRILTSLGGTNNIVTNELCSGTASTNAPSDEAADLNALDLDGSGKFQIAQTNLPMRVRWLYVRQDGTLTNALPSYNAANPTVGRFAFWADDESARINLNTAWSRTAANTNVASHPSKVNLEVLLSAVDAGAMRDYRTNSHFFNSSAEAGQVNDNCANSYATNSFGVTHYSHTPDLNMYGQPRIMLTTSATLAGGTNCLDILQSPGLDPGKISSLDPTKVGNVAHRLYDILTRTTWPVLPGKSFQDKFNPVAAPVSSSRVMQLALNIIDYVRGRESPNAVVEPIRGYSPSQGVFVMGSPPAGQVSVFLGNARGLRMTEFGVWVAPQPTTPGGVTFQVKFKVKVHLPRHFGLDQLDLSQVRLLTWAGVGGGLPATADPEHDELPITAGECAGSLLLEAGGSRVITRTRTVIAGSSTRPFDLSVLLTLSAPGGMVGPRLDLVPLRFDAGYAFYYKVDGVTVAEDMITSRSVDDPCANKFKNDWRAQGANTFTTTTPTTLGGTPIAGAQQDTDSAGKVSGDGMWMPSPKGTTTSTTGQLLNPAGVVESVAELGFIHSGMEAAYAASVPWRTLRFQPKADGNNSLPDWLLLDMFSVPTVQASYFDKPGGRLGGRVNLNGEIPSFKDEGGNALFTRPLSVEAVLRGAPTSQTAATTLDPTSSASLALNLAERPLRLAVTGNAYGWTNAYFSRGQMAEIKGVADSGEASEALLRSTVDLFAVRGCVFSVYAIGQAIRQRPDGKIELLGERRFQRMMEKTTPNGSGRLEPVLSWNPRL